MTKIHQHDGVVVDAGRHSSRASLSTMEKEEVLEREKEATKGVDQKALLPALYIGGPKGGAPALGAGTS